MTSPIQVTLVEVMLPYPAPPSLEMHRRAFFGAALRFDADEAGYRIAREDLEVRLLGANPGVSGRLRARADVLLAEQAEFGPFVAEVRGLLRSTLKRSSVSAAFIARCAGISVRKLGRRLQESGTTYRALLNEIRLERARELLAEPGRPIAGIALEVGFADVRSLQRAFCEEVPRSSAGVSRRICARGRRLAAVAARPPPARGAPVTVDPDRISVRILRPLVLGMRVGGRDADAILRRAGLDPAVLEDGNAWIPLQAALDVWTYVDDGPPHFGLRLAAGIDFTFVASMELLTEYILAQMLITSPTVADALMNLERYSALTFGRFRFPRGAGRRRRAGPLCRGGGAANPEGVRQPRAHLSAARDAAAGLASRRASGGVPPYPTPASLETHQRVFGEAKLISMGLPPDSASLPAISPSR